MVLSWPGFVVTGVLLRIAARRSRTACAALAFVALTLVPREKSRISTAVRASFRWIGFTMSLPSKKEPCPIWMGGFPRTQAATHFQSGLAQSAFVDGDFEQRQRLAIRRRGG